MTDECTHKRWTWDEYKGEAYCNGCSKRARDIIADLRAQVAAKQERIDDLLSQASDAEGLFKLEEARAQRLEELIAYWEEQAEQTLNWRQTRGMKTATDVSMFASCAQSAVIKFLRDIRFARDAALARQEEQG